MKNEMQKLINQLGEMLDNIEKFSKEDVREIREGISDLILLAEKTKKKHGLKSLNPFDF